MGYSGVVFGWMALISTLHPGTSVSVFGLASLPLVFAPFESLVLTSILIPQADFIGHLAGILAGYMVASGAFQVGRAERLLVLHCMFWTPQCGSRVSTTLLYVCRGSQTCGQPFVSFGSPWPPSSASNKQVRILFHSSRFKELLQLANAGHWRKLVKCNTEVA